MKNTKTIVEESAARFMHYAREIMPNASKQEIAQLAEQMCVETYKQIKQLTPRPRGLGAAAGRSRACQHFNQNGEMT